MITLLGFQVPSPALVVRPNRRDRTSYQSAMPLLPLYLDFDIATHDIGVGDEVQDVDSCRYRLLFPGVLHQHPEHDYHAAVGSDISCHGRLLQHPEEYDGRDAVQVQEPNVCA